MFLGKRACVYSPSDAASFLSDLSQTSQAFASVGPKLVYPQTEKQVISDHPLSPPTELLLKVKER